MQNRGLLIGVGVLVAAALVGGYFVLSQGKSIKPASPAETMSTIKTEETTTQGTTREVIVEGDEYSFTPNNISVIKGEKISLTFKNLGRMSHNLIIDSLGISTKTISGGKSETIEFTATSSGTLAFYCSVGNHKSLGMKGEIEVK